MTGTLLVTGGGRGIGAAVARLGGARGFGVGGVFGKLLGQRNQIGCRGFQGRIGIVHGHRHKQQNHEIRVFLHTSLICFVVVALGVHSGVEPLEEIIDLVLQIACRSKARGLRKRRFVGHSDSTSAA